MNYKNKKKLNALDIQKMRARFELKKEEFKKLSLDELQEKFQKGGISSTDRQAIVAATDFLIKEEMAKIAKEKESKNNIDEE